jgi:hypothetical protein
MKMKWTTSWQIWSNASKTKKAPEAEPAMGTTSEAGWENDVKKSKVTEQGHNRNRFAH